MYILFIIVTVIVAYLLGSISFAIIFANAFTKKDVRTVGSGNAGATNVLRNIGVLPGVLTFLCDALKGLAAVLLGKFVFEYIHLCGEEWALGIYGAYVCGLFCMLGHVFPIFHQFRGGKGVATSVGIFAICCPIAIISGVSVFAIITALSKLVSLGSVCATVVVVTLSLVFHDNAALFWPQAVCAVLMGIIVITKHSSNIKRLINGTESKLGKGGK